MDYICLGLSTLDYNWSVPQIPASGEKVLANHFFPAGGGMAATAAVTIARLGGEVAFWGRAGDDSAGHIMQQELREHGVNVDHFQLFGDARSPVAAVLVDPQGERQISTFRGDGLPESSAWLPLDTVANARAALADMRWLDGAAALFSSARQHGIPTVLDADIADSADYSKLLAHCDYAICSAIGLKTFAPGCDVSTALQQARQLGCIAAGVTNGNQGSLWLDKNALHHVPAVEIDAVDTTGAGDVFHGAFTLRIGEGYPCLDALEYATAAAAIKCSQPGGRTGIPDRQTLTDFIKSRL